MHEPVPRLLPAWSSYRASAHSLGLLGPPWSVQPEDICLVRVSERGCARRAPCTQPWGPTPPLPLSQVAETCQLAVGRLEWLQQHPGEAGSAGPYLSVDPAPPAAEQDVGRLREALLDQTRPLFERYRAMFALRNVGGEEAALALAEGEAGPGSWNLVMMQPWRGPGKTAWSLALGGPDCLVMQVPALAPHVSSVLTRFPVLP